MQEKERKVNALVKHDYGEEGREDIFVKWQNIEKKAGLKVSTNPDDAFCQFIQHKRELLACYEEERENSNNNGKRDKGRIIAIEFFYDEGEEPSGWLYINRFF